MMMGNLKFNVWQATNAAVLQLGTHASDDFSKHKDERGTAESLRRTEKIKNNVSVSARTIICSSVSQSGNTIFF